MKSEPPLLGPLRKAERAKAQINDLNFAIKAYLKATRYEIVSEVYPEADEEVWRFQLTEQPPHDLDIRTGEILHNLRSALDNMLSELVVRISKRTDSGVEFPFGLDFNKFETALGKQKKLPAGAADLIRDCKPYFGGDGDALLCLLQSLNRRDKHRYGLVPINRRTGSANTYLSIWYGQALVIGARTGQHLTCERSLTAMDLLKSAVSGMPIVMYGTVKMKPDGSPVFSQPWGAGYISYENIGTGSAEDSLEFLTTTPGAKVKHDFKPTFDIAFRNIEGFEREPVIHVLTQLRDLVEGIVLKFRNRFFP